MIYDQGALGNANAFYTAFKVLSDNMNKAVKIGDAKGAGLYLIPAAVNCAFSCELHLKAMLPIGTRGHKLYTELFKQLDSNTANNIQNCTVTLMQEVGSKTYSATDFENDCLANERAFESWRYFHEGNTPNLSFNVQFMTLFLESLRAIATAQNQQQANINSALSIDSDE